MGRDGTTANGTTEIERGMRCEAENQFASNAILSRKWSECLPGQTFGQRRRGRCPAYLPSVLVRAFPSGTCAGSDG